jgi:hypothetical protein
MAIRIKNVPEGTPHITNKAEEFVPYVLTTSI